jgi:hypothetical protein
MSNPTELLGLTLTNEQYHGDTSRISKSGLDLINKSPLHYHYRYLDPNRKPEAEKDWAKTGNAVGCAILEPDVFAEKYTILDDLEICREIGGARPQATNRYKDWYAERLKELAGKTILTAAEYNEAIAMRDAVRQNKAAKYLLQEGQAERTFYYTDPVTGAELRIRPDWLATLAGYICDVKTSADASPDSFARSVAKFRYHVQDPFYTDGLKANGIEFKGFAFIVVEKDPPHPAAVYMLPKEAVTQGRREIRENLDTYAGCLKSGKWPSYTEQVLELTMPNWLFK